MDDPALPCISCGARLRLSPAPTDISPLDYPVLPQSPAAPTTDETEQASGPASPSNRVISQTRFVTGTTIAGRYRIIALIGKGGMGEVYRADDLKLEQEIALKFLPNELTYDGAALARFHREVRLARQISHRNVCRVFDIEDADGVPFVTMEYVDGENLQSLLRRVGRFPQDRGIDLARQICGGLGAAHDFGILHRDLKPANIMVDANGHVRIMDFGLSTLANSTPAEEMRAGTPAYMAPEQFDGRTPTIKSDLYSLGIVLYEIFTGQHPFPAATYSELVQKRKQSQPKSPSTLTKELNPLIDKVILQCLQNDAANRPDSAFQVATELPGGDPVRAALAAGETPSPEMVAASGLVGGLRPAIAWSLLGGTLFLVVAFVSLCSPARFYKHMKLIQSSELLAQRAREFIQQSGQGGYVVDNASGFYDTSPYLDYFRTTNRSTLPSGWGNLSQLSVLFWYRQSPRFLLSESLFADVSAEDDPPLTYPGMIGLAIDASGRVIGYVAVPPRKADVLNSASPPDWNRFLRAAGYETADWIPVAPQQTPPTYADARAAFQGTLSDIPGVSARIEMATHLGKLVFLQTIFPWTQREDQPNPLGAKWPFAVISAAVVVILLFGAIWLARRNLLKGRGDRRGASRLAFFVFGLDLTISMLVGHHIPGWREIGVIFFLISRSFLRSATVWVLYLALEPLARRHWPSTMISWSRVLAARLRDPLVGRDILIGCAAGTLGWALSILGLRIPTWLGGPQHLDFGAKIFAGVQPAIASALSDLNMTLIVGIGFFLLIALVRALFRRNWLVYGIFALIGLMIYFLSEDSPFWSIASGLYFLDFFLTLVVLLRFGLVATIVSFYVSDILDKFPITFDTTAWYFGTGLLGLLITVALAVYGFYFSLAGKPVFGALSIDE